MTLCQRFAIYFVAALKLDACSYTILIMDSRVISLGCDPSGFEPYRERRRANDVS